VALSACQGSLNPLATQVGTGAPGAVANETPDSRGVITYASYQVVVARDGDTLSTVASRLGISATELANRNSLPQDYRLRQGEVLLLPDSFPRTDALGGTVTTQALGTGWSPERAAEAIDGGAAATPSTGATANPFQNGQKEPLIDPVRHRVEAGETAYSIARLYGVSVTSLASWNGLGPDLTVRKNQELLIPIVSGANSISSSAGGEPGEATPIAPPPSAATPLPENIVTPTAPVAPDLGQYRTPQGGKLVAPVTGTVARPYNAANPNGVGFAVAAGTPVKAAGDGEVALISSELGGQGSIILIRHRDDLITTYSTLSNVAVKKGDRVKAGQVIGAVAPRANPELQFDVFRGTASVDPMTYLPK
jgi:murein DD-endopeptidase MepM/ murein hydrolase activator NlpD